MRLLLVVCLTITWPVLNAQKDSGILTIDSVVFFQVSNAKELLEDCSGSYFQDRVDSFWSPVSADADSIQANIFKLKNQLYDYCTDYTMQCVGIYFKGKKLVYVNAYPTEKVEFIVSHLGNMSEIPVSACGGGSLFWRAAFDPVTKEFSQLLVNAPY